MPQPAAHGGAGSFFIMVFSSELFLFYFLPCALMVYYLARGRGRNAVLTVISYLFYGWANPLFMVLMLASTVVDYICGRAMTGGFRKRIVRHINMASKTRFWR